MSAPYIHSQPVLKTFFFVHEILQLVLPSNDLGAPHLVCGTGSQRDERKEVETRVSDS